MNSRDNQLWLKSWRDKRTGFHQESINPLLIKFWPTLKLPNGSRVFVPLCGKSSDMIWLAEQGHHVIGVELSPIAVEAFFHENGLHPVKRQIGKLTQWQDGRITIFCGDYFSINPSDIGEINTVYDRASLTALPEDIRAHYIAQLQRIVPRSAELFLLTTEDAEEDETMKEALGVAEEITTLYSTGFDITLAHVESQFEPDPDYPEQPPIRVEYKVYRLTSKTAPN